MPHEMDMDAENYESKRTFDVVEETTPSRRDQREDAIIDLMRRVQLDSPRAEP